MSLGTTLYGAQLPVQGLRLALMAGETPPARQESRAVSPNTLPSDPSAPRMARRGGRGVPAGSGVGMTVRAGTASTRKCAPRMVLPIVFGKNRGGRTGTVPGVPSRAAHGSEGRMRAKLKHAGRCTNRTPSQPRRSRAENRREKEVPFPVESELPLPENLRNAFPRRTPWESARAIMRRRAAESTATCKLGTGNTR